MDFIKVAENIYYMPSGTNIGVIISTSGAIFIDSGIDAGITKKAVKILKEENIEVHTLINTHAHADHCGGNYYLQKNMGVKIYAPEIEASFIEHPYLAPSAFFSNACPPLEIRNKFLMMEPSIVDVKIDKNLETINIDNMQLKIINLQGHSINHIGVQVGNILFCGDALFESATIDKHKIPFSVDIEKLLITLDFLRNKTYDYVILGHGNYMNHEQVLESIDLYEGIINRVQETIIESLKNGENKTTIEILKIICDKFEVSINSLNQYGLMNTTCMGYLSYLNNCKRISHCVKDNILYWVLC